METTTLDRHRSPRAIPGWARDIPSELIELVPATVCRSNDVIPLRREGEAIVFMTPNVSNILLADKLAFLVNCKVLFRFSTRDEILRAIDFRYIDVGDIVREMAMMPMDAEVDAEVDADADDDVAAAMRPTLVDTTRSAPMLPSPKNRVASVAFRSAGPITTPPTLRYGMFRVMIPEGERVLVTDHRGRTSIVVGPARIWSSGKTISPMRHYVAHPGSYLIVRFRDGRQEHHAGPSEIWLDPRIHQDIERRDALQIAAKEAVVVYARNDTNISRRVVQGPTRFVPMPGEWLHTFTWHGSEGGSTGVQKVAKGLVFQKLWLLPDQMYHDVHEVRTTDDAVLTIKLMIFFELLDMDKMLDATHDPIGDFINAATSDVVDYVGRRSFEQFKRDTSKLNDLDTYAQLQARAAQTGYRINKVVYRGYTAPQRLQAMHDQAIEARTKLELDRATEEQAQELEDFRLETTAELELHQQRLESQLTESRRLAEQRLDLTRQSDARQRDHLDALRAMGVDLTEYLTQGRADRIIELRGSGNGAHVHLDRLERHERHDGNDREKN
jgi:hypothetical protein